MKLLLRFGFYSEDELKTILVQRSQFLRWRVEDAVTEGIAKRSKGTPRLALRLLQHCYRVCRADRDTEIAAAHLQKACSLEKLDDLGLDGLDREYLKKIREGRNRLNVLASALGTKPRTLSEVVEPDLIRQGLIAKDDHGRRFLTPEGRTHVSNSCPIEV
jgi:Holliday junction DNA helicase RuvB